MEATETKEEQELDIRIKGRRKEEAFEMHFFCSGIMQNISLRDKRSDEETCVKGSGHE